MNDQQEQHISKIIEYLNKDKKHVKNVKGVNYVWCISDILDNLDIQIFGQKLKDFPDVQKEVYEGGFKIWECELDGLDFFADQNIFENKEILELGCGSGLIGILALQKNAKRVYFQDYNKQVLLYHTIVNLQIQQQKDLIEKSQFIYGPWSDLKQKKLQFLNEQNSVDMQGIDIMIGGDILYETQHYQDLLDIFDVYLKKDGQVYIISKMYYFGNGGSYYEFEEFVNKDKRFECINQNYKKEKIGGNKRVILKLIRKNNQKFFINLKKVYKLL